MPEQPASKGPMPPMPPSNRARALALRFISGKYQGHVFPIQPGKEIVIGRSGDLEMVLAEDMVSRRHARINFQGEEIFIEDLASTNGTFVNGEKIRKARLREGDRVLVGTSILKVVWTEAVAPTTGEQARKEMEAVASHRRSQVRTMSGSIEEIPLPDLLQLLGTSKKNGVLVIRTDDDTGRIYMRKGDIYFASINEAEEIPPLKCLYRMLTWERGMFDLEPTDEREFPNAIDVNVQSVLMEGMRQLDELNRLRDQLPDARARLRMPQPLTVPLRSLSPNELDVLQLAYNHGFVEPVLNQCLLSDLEAAEALIKLIQHGYLRAE